MGIRHHSQALTNTVLVNQGLQELELMEGTKARKHELCVYPPVLKEQGRAFCVRKVEDDLIQGRIGVPASECPEQREEHPAGR